MWVASGQPADLFWDQTPRHFQTVMRGARRRLENESDLATINAWQVANFSNAAMSGKLKPLKHYLRKEGAQSPADAVAMLKAMGAKSDMKVRRVRRS